MSDRTLADMAQMLDREGVAELLGVSPATVSQYRSVSYKGRFPEPAGYMGRSPYWTRESIITWAQNRPGPGRPRKAK